MRPTFRALRRAYPALAPLILSAALAACGGGDLVESLVRLITARFVPADVTVTAGTHRVVQLEVTCDRNGLDTAFGRLSLRVKLDPSHTLAGGVMASLFQPPGADGFVVVPCNATTGDPDLRIATMDVDVVVAAGTPAQTTRLTAYIEIEPLAPGDPSKDSTTADLAIHVGAGEGAATPQPG